MVTTARKFTHFIPPFLFILLIKCELKELKDIDIYILKLNSIGKSKNDQEIIPGVKLPNVDGLICYQSKKEREIIMYNKFLQTYFDIYTK